MSGMYVARRCGCGRIFHDYLWFHNRVDDRGLCDLCLSMVIPGDRSIRWVLPHQSELSPEPIVNGDEEPFAPTLESRLRAGV